MFKPETRNLDNIQFANLRQTVDAKFNTAHDELSIAYYDFWKHGQSKPWKGYDVQATPEESKALFDKLHGLIFHLHELALEAEHVAQGRSNEKYEAFSTREKDGKRRSQTVRERVAEYKANGIELAL
jgi:hypothetical protein